MTNRVIGDLLVSSIGDPISPSRHQLQAHHHNGGGKSCRAGPRWWQSRKGCRSQSAQTRLDYERSEALETEDNKN